MMKSGHTLGSHLGVDSSRLTEMKNEFIEKLIEQLENNPVTCECDVIRIITEIANTPAEIATLGFQVGENMLSLMASMKKAKDDAEEVIN